MCSDLQDYYRYSLQYDRVVSLEKNELLATTGCLRPCQYMEYLVKEGLKFFFNFKCGGGGGAKKIFKKNFRGDQPGVENSTLLEFFF